MLLKDKTVFITGASGGIGSALVHDLVQRKAKKIYAADLSMGKLIKLEEKYGGIIVPILLNVTDLEDIQFSLKTCQDADVLINNAGVECATSFLHKDAGAASRLEMGVNYYGIRDLCSAFWNSLIKKESAIINILSVGSLHLIPNLGTYCASKAAAHFLTQGMRHASIGTQLKVFGVYPGYVDTNMTRNLDVEKSNPFEITSNVLDAVERDILDIFPDKMSKELYKRLGLKNNDQINNL
jgi:NAD(P)-dependent dehydrogenase (short-subunit alcohol dehydrogenase family)